MFRIEIYLNFLTFIKGIISNKKLRKINEFIQNKLTLQSKKKYLVLASQCRVGFLFILKYLKTKKKKKNEIIFCAYNLPEMVNVAIKLGYKIIFCDINYQNGTMDIRDIQKKISSKTAAIVMTNMFNDMKYSENLRKLANKNKITLIEDNAICFDNYTYKKNKKIYTGVFGHFTIYSFNIMKNISSFYGGAVTTSDDEFIKYYKREYKNLSNFPKLSMLKQIFIYLILKIMSLKFFYKLLFFHIIKFAHLYKISFILRLFYPSLKKIKRKLPNFYFTKISDLSAVLSYYQIKDIDKRKKIFSQRKLKLSYYFKSLSINPKNDINLIKIKDKNFQNFLDFPLLVKNKDMLNKFLLSKGIEVRLKHYYNCEKLFLKKTRCLNAEKYEKELICLPAHSRVNYFYIDYIIKNINRFYSKSLKP